MTGQAFLDISPLNEYSRQALLSALDSVGLIPLNISHLPYFRYIYMLLNIYVLTDIKSSNNNKIPGKKGLVVDPSLTGPLSLVAEYTTLKVLFYFLSFSLSLPFSNSFLYGITLAEDIE